MTSENSATPKSDQIQAFNDLIDEGQALYEQANALLIQAGQMFEQAKALAKRKFNKALGDRGIDSKETNKLIKAVQTANQLTEATVSRLGLPLLLRLSQPSNKEALEAIKDHEVTQVQAVKIIKEFKSAPQPKEPPKQVEWIRHKDGTRTLVLRLPDGEIAIALEQVWKQSAEPLPYFLSHFLAPEPVDINRAVQQEFLEYLEQQSNETLLLGQIDDVKQAIEKLSHPKDATEAMMLRSYKDELAVLEYQLHQTVYPSSRYPYGVIHNRSL
ncbi:MAG: hypothetical protein SAK29_29825 [Scytonema sp. PMC 1069.18]|nr:hypothetical protein [Scytonema sp. PMC 1069.18]MEC4885806.1 hypothetical protein [Scytonema sp. PMC 1070.18]